MLAVKSKIQILSNAEELSQRATEAFVRLANQAVRKQNYFTVALAGGSTPKGVYSLLASEIWRARLPWQKMHFFWGDERHVSQVHPDSNYRMAHEAMLAHVPVPSANIYRIKAENPDASQAAKEYEQTLSDFFHFEAGQFPRFDLVLLGMGPDGHTASLFPGTEALHERKRLVVANWVEKLDSYRITLTVPTINSAANVIYLVTGEEKARTLQEVWEGTKPEPLPAQLIRPINGELLWLVNQAAARYLSDITQ